MLVHKFFFPSGGGHGNPLQYSCLENPMDRGAQGATVHRVAKSQTQLKWLNRHTFFFFFFYENIRDIPDKVFLNFEIDQIRYSWISSHLGSGSCSILRSLLFFSIHYSLLVHLQHRWCNLPLVCSIICWGVFF